MMIGSIRKVKDILPGPLQICNLAGGEVYTKYVSQLVAAAEFGNKKILTCPNRVLVDQKEIGWGRGLY